MPGWSWGSSRAERFATNVGAVRAHVQEHDGRYPRRSSASAQERSLAEWCGNCRRVRHGTKKGREHQPPERGIAGRAGADTRLELGLRISGHRGGDGRGSPRARRRERCMRSANAAARSHARSCDEPARRGRQSASKFFFYRAGASTRVSPFLSSKKWESETENGTLRDVSHFFCPRVLFPRLAYVARARSS